MQRFRDTANKYQIVKTPPQGFARGGVLLDVDKIPDFACLSAGRKDALTGGAFALGAVQNLFADSY